MIFPFTLSILIPSPINRRVGELQCYLKLGKLNSVPLIQKTQNVYPPLSLTVYCLESEHKGQWFQKRVDAHTQILLRGRAVLGADNYGK